MTDTRWLLFWDRSPRQCDPKEHLRQVGRTVDGREVSIEQVALIAEDISSRLCLEPSDVLLDLCCGNGLITARLATRCHHVVGVDFSEPLLAVARREFSPANVEYRLGSVRNLPGLNLPPRLFTKVLMYDALQHFTPADFRRLLPQLLTLAAPHCLILLGGVPYKPHRRRLINTRAKWLRYWYLRLSNRDLIGTWWTRRDVAKACDPLGLKYELHKQRPDLYNAAFRVDVSIW